MPTRGRPRLIKIMKFSFPKHYTTGLLGGDDLTFFYYDIGLDNFQGWPDIYDWDAITDEFKEVLDIDTCLPNEIDADFERNKIRFTVSSDEASRSASKSAAFFRHLRNAFSHYNIVREGDDFVLTDNNKKNMTMRGLVNADLLKKFCFRFFDEREAIINANEQSENTLFKNN